MRRFLTVWFRGLFRPKITTIKVILYENGQEKCISAFPDYVAICILKSINQLFETRDKSRYWFETAVYEQGGLFQKKKIEVLSTCYQENPTAPDRPSPTNIPDRFRKRIFDKVHRIVPELPSGKPYSQRLEVKFSIPK